MRKWVLLLAITLAGASFADPYFGSADSGTNNSNGGQAATPMSAQDYQQAVKAGAQQTRNAFIQQFKQDVASQPNSSGAASQASAGQNASAPPTPASTSISNNPSQQAPAYTGFPTQNSAPTPAPQPSNQSGGWNVKY